jgi:hypothetical protein
LGPWLWGTGWWHSKYVVSATEREQLAAIAADRNRPRKHIERTRIVLASADRHSAQRVAQSIGISRPTVWRWQQRFAESGVEGLLRDKTRKPGKAPDRRGNDSASGGADLHRPAATSDLLDRPGDGQTHRHFRGFGAAHLAGTQTAAAPAPDLQALARSELCRQADRQIYRRRTHGAANEAARNLPTSYSLVALIGAFTNRRHTWAHQL